MQFFSTRGGEAVSAAQAVVRGISPSGGLYVPGAFPELDLSFLCGHADDYRAIARHVMQPYLAETDGAALADMIDAAYGSFDSGAVVPLHMLNDRESVAELWHGPTMAFKDVALQMLPHLMTSALSQLGETHGVYILVATSGDTGKAALAGFADVPGTRVLVFYPEGGVSEAQRLQMVTQRGGNVDVCAVRGNFDDAQTGVKRIFSDEAVREKLERCNWRLSSANSINFGRLLPQIVYYCTSYARLVQGGRIRCGEPVNFCVPTGNFGDILAGEYARRMGLPVKKLICASNRNNVLTDFFSSGIYDDRRTFYKSMSCSMDILISSNLERLLFDLAGGSPETVCSWMRSLAETGRYDVGAAARDRMAQTFAAGWCSERDTLSAIKRVFDETGYLMDPHTAVGQTVYERYAEETGDTTQTVLLSTANPYKFATAVLGVFETPGGNDLENADRLHAVTGAPIPAGVAELRNQPERFHDVCELFEMPSRVLRPLGAE